MNHKQKTKQIAATLSLIGMVMVVPASAYAQAEFPNRPINLLVGYSAGGPTDNAARVIAEEMGKELGQPVVVVNKPGASGLVAAKDMMAAQPDGYTILLAANAFFTLGPARYTLVDYDFDKDFVPIGGLSGYPHLLTVAMDSPIKSMEDLIDYSRKNPGKLNAARVGFSNEIAVEWLNLLGKMDITQIPYKGAATVVSDLSSGRIDLALIAPSVTYPLQDGDKARAIATTRETPITKSRQIPAVSKTAGMEEFDMYIWNGLFAPAGIPAPVVQKLAAALNQSLAQPKVQKQFETAFLDAAPMTAEELTKAVHEELSIAKHVVKEAKLPLLTHQ
ncbi:Bug family tripartite tricarboxylate transporter substrate binding protein [Orrella sp. 11846]|uniref:Bug family tripartite tricarboxylate transporter substrate binding protein n=1 Tax=Orrella sp. 11846 TaxID=3409913 RepID=UPI003B594F11